MQPAHQGVPMMVPQFTPVQIHYQASGAQNGVHLPHSQFQVHTHASTQLPAQPHPYQLIHNQYHSQPQMVTNQPQQQLLHGQPQVQTQLPIQSQPQVQAQPPPQTQSQQPPQHQVPPQQQMPSQVQQQPQIPSQTPQLPMQSAQQLSSQSNLVTEIVPGLHVGQMPTQSYVVYTSVGTLLAQPILANAKLMKNDAGQTFAVAPITNPAASQSNTPNPVLETPSLSTAGSISTSDKINSIIKHASQLLNGASLIEFQSLREISTNEESRQQSASNGVSSTEQQTEPTPVQNNAEPPSSVDSTAAGPTTRSKFKSLVMKLDY